jgi:sulfate/thiosulfate transport system permease protein
MKMTDFAREAVPLRVENVGRRVLIATALLFLSVVLVGPLAVVFTHAFAAGVDAYIRALAEPETLAAIRLSIVVATLSVIANVAFGLAAAWSIAKFEFRGKSLLVAVIDIPFSVSPVIAGLVFVLLFGMHGWFGPWLNERGIDIIFALPGLVLATTFVTLPIVARELIPLMQEQGVEEEEAARSLGAGGWQIMRRVVLPNIRLGLLYGVLLCNARAMGEFGAVSVVSGHIRGQTNTIPLHVEILYNDYNFVGTFAVSSILTALAMVTLVAKSAIERRAEASGRRS